MVTTWGFCPSWSVQEVSHQGQDHYNMSCWGFVFPAGPSTTREVPEVKTGSQLKNSNDNVGYKYKQTKR